MSDDKIYLSSKSSEKENHKGGWLSFFLILFGLGAFFISPAPRYLISLIPDSLIKSSMKSMYQEIDLSNNDVPLAQPQKYTHTSPLNVLGHNSGICFLFNKENIDKKISNRAQRGREIAEIIALSMRGVEYILDEVTLDKDENTTVICQKFGLRYSVTPDQIKAIYIRPLSPLTPHKIKWVTVKKL